MPNVRRLMEAWFALFLAAYISAHGNTVIAAESVASDDLQSMDRRVLAISHRLTTASAHRCPTTMPALGLTLHSRDQYSQAAPNRIAQLFPNGGLLAVQEVLPGGPARAAGVPPLATITKIADWSPVTARSANRQLRLQAHDYLSQLPSDQPLLLSWTSGAEPGKSVIQPVAACRVFVEVAISDKRFARSNGPIIQISSRFVSMLNDDQLAVVLSHELAHSALEHRKKLASLNVSNGIFAEFGRSRLLKREAEIEADRVSLYILREAGYDPSIAPFFWRSEIVKKSSGGIFRNRAHPSAKRRAKLMGEEIVKMKLRSVPNDIAQK